MKKKRNLMGRQAKQQEVAALFRPGAIVIESLDDAVETLTEMEEAKAAIQPVLDFIEEARKSATEFVRTTDKKVIQLDGAYYRRQSRTSSYMVATDAQIPENSPKGTKSIQAICKGKTISIKRGGKMVSIPLWSYVTRRHVDKAKLDLAVKKGALTDKEVGKAYLETEGAVFIQRYDGIPPEERDES